MANAGVSPNVGTANAGWVPRNERTVTAPTTLETTTGLNAPTENDPSTSSSAKNAPANGALNAPAIPAAAPHPTRIFTHRARRPNKRPIADPVVAPSTATGPSLPADAPDPRVSAEAMVRITTGRLGISPPCFATARWTSGTFCPSGVRVCRTMAHAASMPAAVMRGSVTPWASGSTRWPSHFANTKYAPSISL